MNASDAKAGDGGHLRRLASEKMTRVLGEHRAAYLVRTLLDDRGAQLATPDDLYDFASALSDMGGIESAVGALLRTKAVMLGAEGRPAR